MATAFLSFSMYKQYFLSTVGLKVKAQEQIHIFFFFTNAALAGTINHSLNRSNNFLDIDVIVLWSLPCIERIFMVKLAGIYLLAAGILE